MATLVVKPKLEMTIVLALAEEEAMALDALAGYGTAAFLKVFYAQMGEAYLKPYEQGLISLFAAVRAVIPGYREQAHAARKIFEGK